MRAATLDRRNFLLGAAGGALAVVAATACSRVGLGAEPDGGTLLERLRERGEVRVGFANESPYGFINSEAELTGESPEVARVIYQRLGVERLVPIPSEFGALISGLKVGLFDMIGAGMSVTPSRCEEVLFTNPHFIAPAAFLVPAGNPQGIRTFEDVAAKPDFRLGVLIGAVEADYAEASGVPASRITPYADQPSGLDAVLTDRVDGFALTTISLKDALSKRQDAPLEITPGFVPIVQGRPEYTAGAFAFLPDQTNIVNAFNQQLAELKASGELLRIMAPFGFSQEEMTNLTSAELCSAPAS
ncbi:amino acid ABC transporter substrate-binding protein (PAAT family) [Saccharopolyspora erythraea NRRL 2338]|uniref:ABC transporter amino acid-binding protein n=2 Tax=Saccharopolyspora erythraea TaxID=1836 RepID=A4FN16_SACEN|nr:ectoine/hydroxyectoine ABC transporter substrate-binding protein EhuB [Saccharopolyspora erythraea]PFG99084.1 amino acid ABC transporter substrate-binding protein (PAAT family) [Saccharopolyspora erythraea NRRL 2338]QRK89045.1 ectoine/hydroxyectoine ABC transporter substrate-binding protein EhuB [Saccharopolyspora erythraea]CAM05441.1 putative ABC transporter amino acid-binding protein [Saccharopolyspora erythraea NRRL 2338]